MSPAKAALPKPKRPLSGYNLFYRYKRNKVLEATANGRDDKAVIHAVLTAVTGLEGVPPHSPIFNAPLADLNAFRAANIRAAMEGKLFPNENERSRLHRKVHGMGFVEMCKMMRQTWGQADACTKDVFNDLAEVGRVRYRRLVEEYKYKKNKAKMSDGAAPSISSEVDRPRQKSWPDVNSATEVGPATTASQAGPSTVGAPKAAAVAEATKPSLIPDQARSPSDASAEPTPEPKIYRRRVSIDGAFQAPVHDRGISGQFRRPSFDATMNLAKANDAADPEKTSRPSYQRTVTAELDRCGDSLQPLPFETAAVPERISISTHGGRGSADVFRAVHGGAGQTYRRRGSAEIDIGASFPAVHHGVGHAPAAFAMGDSNVGSDTLEGLETKLDRQQLMINDTIKNVPSVEGLKQLLLEDAIQDLRRAIVQNNARLPPEMQVALRNNFVGEGGRARRAASFGPSALADNSGGGNYPEEGAMLDLDPLAFQNKSQLCFEHESGATDSRDELSARDFMEFIDELDDAIDIGAAAAGATKKTKDCTADGRDPSSVFGEPVRGTSGPDSGDEPKPVGPVKVAVPIPADCKRLNAKGARVA